jgi:hypothetical protein
MTYFGQEVPADRVCFIFSGYYPEKEDRDLAVAEAKFGRSN